MINVLFLLFLVALGFLLSTVLLSIVRDRKAKAILLTRLAARDQAFDQPESLIWHPVLEGKKVRIRMDCSVEGLAFHLNGSHRRLSFPVREWQKLSWYEHGDLGILVYRFEADFDTAKKIYLPLKTFDCAEGRHALGWLRTFCLTKR